MARLSDNMGTYRARCENHPVATQHLYKEEESRGSTYLIPLPGGMPPAGGGVVLAPCVIPIVIPYRLLCGNCLRLISQPSVRQTPEKAIDFMSGAWYNTTINRAGGKSENDMATIRKAKDSSMKTILGNNDLFTEFLRDFIKIGRYKFPT